MSKFKSVLAATFSAAVVSMAFSVIPANASPTQNVARHEVITFTVSSAFGGGTTYVHDFTATLNPDGSFTGTGINTSDSNKQETVTGTFLDGNLSFVAYQNQGTVQNPYLLEWGTNPAIAVSNGMGSGTVFLFGPGQGQYPANVSDLTIPWNHGQCVSEGLTADSQCGMPLVAQS